MRLPRSTGAFSGVLIMLLGLWGALIPFVGPYFDYSFGSNSAWHYTTDRLWLCIVPGAVAFVGGLLLLVAATRKAGGFGGWLALMAGAWFVLGPSVSLTWEHAGGPIGRPLYGTTRQMLELVGYFYGLGALLVALSAFAMGRFASRPHIATEAALAAEPARTAPARGGAAPVGTAPRAYGPARRERRSLLRRRRGAPEAEGSSAVER
jgi:hypothetical protein